VGKKFKNTEEAKKALEKAGWFVVRVSKHYTMAHPNVPDIVRVPKKHNYISADVENHV
jgi:hypothetical protein